MSGHVFCRHSGMELVEIESVDEMNTFLNLSLQHADQIKGPVPYYSLYLGGVSPEKKTEN